VGSNPPQATKSIIQLKQKTEMKNYQIVFLTPNGIKTEVYKESESLQDFEKRMVEKYKTFIVQSSFQIK